MLPSFLVFFLPAVDGRVSSLVKWGEESHVASFQTKAGSCVTKVLEGSVGVQLLHLALSFGIHVHLVGASVVEVDLVFEPEVLLLFVRDYLLPGHVARVI